MVNIVEIVNKLPIGTKLYSTICGECTIKKIYEGLGFDVISKDGTTYNFSYDGRFNLNGECCIFPSKENRDWNTFRPFKDGDILTYTSNHTTTFIYRNKDNEPHLSTSFYVACNDTPSHNFLIYNKYTLIALNENCDVRLATEDEKIKLFDAIKANGYKWNAETKTLEKLIVPKFKVGDKIIRSNTLYPILTVTFVNNMVYTVKSNISNEEHDMGVKIVENNYKIATFSPKDLKPFDRLLVKRHNTWQIAHFGYFKNGVIFTEMGQPCNIDVVPYNDETKHLLGTCDVYNGFYKWWN